MTNERLFNPARAKLWCWLTVLLCLAAFAPRAGAAPLSPEDQALSAARKLFDDHQYHLAEATLSHFVTVYTNSPELPFANLYLARARLEQSNYDGAVQLLTGSVAQAGDLAGEYAFWIASARMDRGDYLPAAEGFAGFVRVYTNSPRRLEAAFDEAEAHAKIGNWPRVIQLLRQPDGVFARLAAAVANSSYPVRGRILLGESLYALGRYAEGTAAVGSLDPTGLDPEWQWRRQYLLTELQLAGGQAAQALQTSTNLLDSATGPRHQAASRYLHGEILEALGRTNEALQTYTNNLADGVPPGDQRQALLKTVELTVAQNRAADAMQLLEAYVSDRTNSPALDLALLSLGELDLKTHFTPLSPAPPTDLPPVTTNFLDEALTNFNIVITNFPSSPLVPQAHLDRGWCYWAESNLPPAREDFQAAVSQLGPSAEQAVARFKLGDVNFRESNYTAAVSNYDLLLRDYATMETVSNGLFDQALYQILAASLQRGDQSGAEAALKKILDWYPNSLFGDRGQLLIGESRRYDYGMARREFTELLAKSPNTPLRPKVQFAIARTYEEEGNWNEALREYSQWIQRYASNAPALLPTVEYSRALVYGKAGAESNALPLFTNFVARFPTNDLTPLAQNWVADYYFNQADYQSAEQNYELLYQKYPNAGKIAFEARLMAGRAALAGQRAADANQYFSDLVNATNAPADVVAQGYFALGDTIFQQWQANPTNTALLDQAVRAMSNVTNGAPTNALSVLAFGRLGDYYGQWADSQWEPKHDINVYSNAMLMYQTIVSFPLATVGIETRSEAEVALGRLAEKEDHTAQALLHYCKVLYELDPDHFDPFWVEQAGKYAASIYERQQQWNQAVKVYQRVLEAVPSLRPALEKAITSDLAENNRTRN